MIDKFTRVVGRNLQTSPQKQAISIENLQDEMDRQIQKFQLWDTDEHLRAGNGQVTNSQEIPSEIHASSVPGGWGQRSPPIQENQGVSALKTFINS